MRLHRGDDGGTDEPDEGWVQAGDGPSGPLADVLQTWTVIRHWRGVKAPTAAEAIQQTRGEVVVGDDGYQVVLDHDSVRVSRGEMTMLYHTAGELDMLVDVLTRAIDDLAEPLREAPEEDKAALRAQFTLLNSLRTQFAEARYDLVPPPTDG